MHNFLPLYHVWSRFIMGADCGIDVVLEGGCNNDLMSVTNKRLVEKRH